MLFFHKCHLGKVKRISMGVWSVADRIVVNAGSFSGFGKAAIDRITGADLLVQKLVRKQDKFFPDKTIASFSLL